MVKLTEAHGTLPALQEVRILWKPMSMKDFFLGSESCDLELVDGKWSNTASLEGLVQDNGEN